MKKIMFCLAFILFINVFYPAVQVSSLTAGPAAGQKSIIDYYIQIPDDYFKCEVEKFITGKEKLALIKKKDLKKGFILASTSDGGIPVEVALFTDEYMGIKILAVNVKCASGCMCRKLGLFFISDGNLMKSEADGLFPKPEDIEKAAGVSGGYGFALSQEGKNIMVTDDSTGKVLLILEWAGGMFIIK